MNRKSNLWWRAARPYSYPASLVPVLLGTAAAWLLGSQFSAGRFLLVLVGVLAFHGGANIFNDYYDYKRGVDNAETIGSLGLLVMGEIKSGPLFRLGILYYFAGAIAGCLLWYQLGIWVLWLGVMGAIGGFFYTWGPAFKYRMLGDVSVFLLFGILVTEGSFYVQTGRFSWIPCLYAIPIGLLVVGILHGNNLRDIPDDCKVNVTTLAGLLGTDMSRWFYLFLVALAFISIPVLAVVDHLPWSSLIVVFSLPIAIRNVKVVYKFQESNRKVIEKIDAMGAQLQMVFGLLMTVGILLGKVVV